MPPDDQTARPESAPPDSVPATRTVRLAGAALPPALAHLAEGALGDALTKAIAFAQRSESPATEKIYDDDWRAFRTWCQGARRPRIVAAYLAERAATLGRSGLRLILAAIAFHQRRAGHLWTARDPVIATVMRGILRAQQRPERPAAALTAAELRQLLALIGDDRARGPGKTCHPARPGAAADRPGRAHCGARNSWPSTSRMCGSGTRRWCCGCAARKATRKARGADVVVPRGAHPETCPVRAMEAWLRRSGIAYGAVFRRITAPGTIEARLTGNGVWKILRRRASAAGLTVDDTERLSPHGLRACFITEAYLHGALDEQVQQHARQKSIATTRRYRQRAKVVAASPARLLDL